MNRAPLVAAAMILATAVFLSVAIPGSAVALVQHCICPDSALNANVTLPAGYVIRAAVTGLNFPTGLAFCGSTIFISEAGGIAGTEARIVRVHHDGTTSVVASGFNPPVTDVTFHAGRLYVSHRGTITRMHLDGSGREDIITGLPSMGDHSNAEIAFGSDGMLYLAIGTATNSGVVGPDNFLLSATPTADVPCEDIRVHGVNYRSEDPRTSDPSDSVSTGPYKPFGVTASEGELIPGATKCNGAILRANPDGTGLAVVAWGFRNPFGIGFDGSGQLWAANNGMDERGSRPVEGDVDAFYRVVNGGWYGWPDFAHGEAVNQSEFSVDGLIPQLILAEHPPLAAEAQAFALFDDHVSANKFDFARSDRFGFQGDAFVAETGSFPPITGAETFFGYRVTRVNRSNGQVTVFLANKSGKPAFATGTPGINKPIDVKFGCNPGRMYVLDFGAFLPAPGTEEVTPVVEPGSGVLWLVTKSHDTLADDDGDGDNENDAAPVRIRMVSPNPASREVQVAYSLAQSVPASIRIFDVRGRLVRTLEDKRFDAGDHSSLWDARDASGRVVAQGIYVARVTAGGAKDERKVLILAR